MKTKTVLLLAAAGAALVYFVTRQSAQAAAPVAQPLGNWYPVQAPGVVSNPIQQRVAVLPYSRKQSIIDIPGQLVDAVTNSFTPTSATDQLAAQLAGSSSGTAADYIDSYSVPDPGAASGATGLW